MLSESDSHRERGVHMAKKEKAEILWKDRKHRGWFPLSFTKYSVSNDRLYSQSGFFNTHYDELLLYRITDICLTRTLGQKFFGTGTIILYAKQDAGGQVQLINIKHPKEVKNFLSKAVEESRVKYNVVGKEFYGSGMPHPGHEPFDLDGDFDGDVH